MRIALALVFAMIASAASAANLSSQVAAMLVTDVCAPTMVAGQLRGPEELFKVGHAFSDQEKMASKLNPKSQAWLFQADESTVVLDYYVEGCRVAVMRGSEAAGVDALEAALTEKYGAPQKLSDELNKASNDSRQRTYLVSGIDKALPTIGTLMVVVYPASSAPSQTNLFSVSVLAVQKKD